MTNQIMKLASGKNVYKLKKRKSFQQMLISIYSFFLFYKEGFFPTMFVLNQCWLYSSETAIFL